LKPGILFINLGTPEAPTPKAVRAYLKEFLSDPRVVEIPRLVWLPILHLFVLRTRPKASAARYERIWTRDGSPLRFHTERQAALVRGYLGDRLRVPLAVDYAMRYGKPSIGEKLEAFEAQGCDCLVLVPLYPQYSGSTTGTALDVAHAHLARERKHPEVRTISHFHDDPGYIRALELSVRDHWEKRWRPDILVMSFHGIPRRSIERGDPYHAECQETARLLAEALELDRSQYRVTFQSRFGRAEWLKPYTADVLAELGRQKVERVDVICPGFVSDCLETLEEIAIENKALFLNAGGREFQYVPCLNERHEWIEALCSMVIRNLEGWIATNPRPDIPLNPLLHVFSTGG
jgi:ferrochelatase